MSYLPLFIETTGKKCLIVGGGKVANRKLIPILKAKMKVTLISPEVIEEIELNFQKNKNLKIIKRKFEPEDIEDQFLIIAATNEKTTNQKIAKLSKDNNILVNMAEDSLSGNTLIPSVVDEINKDRCFFWEPLLYSHKTSKDKA